MHHLPNCLDYSFLINAVQSSQFLLRAMFYKFIPDSQTLYRHVACAFSLKKLQNSAAEAPWQNIFFMDNLIIVPLGKNGIYSHHRNERLEDSKLPHT